MNTNATGAVVVDDHVEAALKRCTKSRLADMAASACVLLDFFEQVREETGKATPPWLTDLMALDMLIEDELDGRRPGK